jgi:hypothetical protein
MSRELVLLILMVIFLVLFGREEALDVASARSDKSLRTFQNWTYQLIRRHTPWAVWPPEAQTPIL